MKTIRIDSTVFNYLQSKAKPFEDSPNDVLLRELGLNSALNGRSAMASIHDENGRTGASGFTADRNYTHQSVSGFKFKGQSFPARSFKEVLVNLSNHLRGLHGSDFDKAALRLHGKKRSYFSQTPSNLKFPVQLSGNGLFVETNLSANGIVKISGRLLAELKYDNRELQIN